MDLLIELKELIEEKIPGSIALTRDMTGTMNHIEIFVGADIFEGKMLLHQHQMVMDVLKEILKEKLHAVKIKTMTLKKFKEIFNQE